MFIISICDQFYDFRIPKGKHPWEIVKSTDQKLFCPTKVWDKSLVSSLKTLIAIRLELREGGEDADSRLRCQYFMTTCRYEIITVFRMAYGIIRQRIKFYKTSAVLVLLRNMGASKEDDNRKFKVQKCFKFKTRLS